MSNKQAHKIMAIIGAVLVIWLGLLVAPYVTGGLPKILEGLSLALNHPLNITICEDSLKTVLILLCIYGIAMGAVLSSQKNYRRGVEHGSASWGEPSDLRKTYMQKPFDQNKLLTQHIGIGLNAKKHLRNLNTIVVGGSGAGKSRFYAKPNLMQCNTSFVVLDPKGELLRDTGTLLKSKGYVIRVLNLIDMLTSDCYNPFVYLKNENDVQKLVTNLFKATTPSGSQTQDPFWDTAAKMLLSAFIFYLLSEAEPEEQNFEMVMELLRAADIDEDNPQAISRTDMLFRELEEREPEHIAVKYYKDYHKGAGKTLKSIQVTLATRLEKFNIKQLADMTITDDMDLPSIGEVKTAVFAIIPDNDTSFNFLVSMLYTQLFQQLFELADKKYHGELPVPVHFLMDEFANVALPDDFDKILATMRSRGVFVSIILQNLAQLKALYEKSWESIVGNCDEFLYLGGNEQSTHKYVSELLGKQTIDMNTYGQSKGRNGSYSTNYQITGRELMTPDEVRMLDNRYALLFIRGSKPVRDLKIDPLVHPHASHTPLKGGHPYIIGQLTEPNCMLEMQLSDESDGFAHTTIENLPIQPAAEGYDFLSSDEINKMFGLA